MMLIALVFITYILLDFSFNQAKPPGYQFEIPELTLNKPIMLKQNNMMLIVAKYSQSFLDSIEAENYLKEVSQSSTRSQQLVDSNGFFIVRGNGTHLGCPLVIEQGFFRESCSDATYSLTGKSKNIAFYENLKKVDYYFSQNNRLLTIQ